MYFNSLPVSSTLFDNRIKEFRFAIMQGRISIMTRFISFSKVFLYIPLIDSAGEMRPTTVKYPG